MMPSPGGLPRHYELLDNCEPNPPLRNPTPVLGNQDTRKDAIHISSTEINATVMHTILSNRRLLKPANRLLFRCTISSQHKALQVAPKARLRLPLPYRFPLLVSTNDNGHNDWTSHNVLGLTFVSLRVAEDATASSTA